MRSKPLHPLYLKSHQREGGGSPNPLWRRSFHTVCLICLVSFSQVAEAAEVDSTATNAAPSQTLALGQFFAKKTYTPQPLPKFAEARDALPAPIYDERPEWVEMYWKAWELGFRNVSVPAPGSGFVSQCIDAAFNADIFLWDTCFMTMFCNAAHPLVPGIASLDNFYIKQHDTGEICRQINRVTGVDTKWVNKEGRPLFSLWGWSVGYGPRGADSAEVSYMGRSAPTTPPRLTLDALNNPIVGWAEWESFRWTGDKQRLEMVYEPLVHYYRAFQTYLRQGNGLYMTDWASMDNSPRNVYLRGGGIAVDTSAQMVLFARNLAAIARVLNRPSDATMFAREAEELSEIINRLLWDPHRKFFFDLTVDEKRVPVKTVGAYWTMLAEVATPAQAESLAKELSNPETFGRLHRVPTLAADEKHYHPDGKYWRGSVWAPTTTMVIRGLQRNGRPELARELALADLDVIGRVFAETGTLWENYAPDAATPGKPARKDFVGWTGIGPILYLLEFAVGLEPDAPANRLNWHLQSKSRVGCERFRFGGHVVTLVATPLTDKPGHHAIRVNSDGTFLLELHRDGQRLERQVKAGEDRFEW